MNYIYILHVFAYVYIMYITICFASFLAISHVIKDLRRCEQHIALSAW